MRHRRGRADLMLLGMCIAAAADVIIAVGVWWLVIMG